MLLGFYGRKTHRQLALAPFTHSCSSFAPPTNTPRYKNPFASSSFLVFEDTAIHSIGTFFKRKCSIKMYQARLKGQSERVLSLRKRWLLGVFAAPRPMQGDSNKINFYPALIEADALSFCISSIRLVLSVQLCTPLPCVRDNICNQVYQGQAVNEFAKAIAKS